MTDREMLEYAAKVAGINITRDPMGRLRNTSGFDCFANIFSAPFWNPLTDDGDALRLAVKLRLDVSVCNGTSYADGTESVFPNIGECQGQDAYAATRRAIVRAAAEIGKAM